MQAVQTELELLEKKRDDYFKLDPRQIEIEEGFNKREDYGDMHELVESIRANGVLNPVKGYRIRKKGEEDRFVLTNGHRRHRAAMMLIEEGVEIRVPFVGGGKPSEVDRLVETYVGNEGKPLNAVEQAAVVAQLIQYGLEPKEVAAKLAVTTATVSNLLTLSKVKPTLKKKIVQGVISPTMVLKLVRSKNGLTPDNVDEHIEQIIKASREEAINNAPEREAPGLRPLSSSGGSNPPKFEKPEKVTQKDVDKAAGIEPSFTHFTNLLKKIRKEKLEVEKNEEFFAILSKMADGKLDAKQISNIFF